MRSRERRRLHLLQRQLDAIHALEAQVAQPVSPADGCEAWLVDAVAARLHRARSRPWGPGALPADPGTRLVASAARHRRAQGPGDHRVPARTRTR
jgi:hypothetical protein